MIIFGREVHEATATPPIQVSQIVRVIPSRLLTKSPTAFSRYSEAQRTAESTIRLFAGCGLAGRLV